MEEKIIKLSQLIKKKDMYTYQHSVNVANYINAYCKFYSLDFNFTKNIVYAALLHDIGKLFINKNILYKKGELTNTEIQIIRKHTLYGYMFLKIQNIPRNIYMFVLYHHFRIDNKNDDYNFSKFIHPKDRLNNNGNMHKFLYGICLLNICDSYEAMTSKRVYNKKKNNNEAIKEIKRCINSQFQQEIAYNFINLIYRNREYEQDKKKKTSII